MNDRFSPARQDPSGDDSRVEALLRRAGVVEEPPPPRVWESVVAGLRGPVPAGDVAPAGMPQRATDLDRHRERRSALRERRAARGRAPRALPLLAAAAAGALLTWAGLAALDGRVGRTDGEVVARAELAPLVDEQPDGTAQVVEVDGHQHLRVELAGTPQAADGYLEVWLLTPDASGMVTLGVLDGASGDYVLPDGLELAEYPLVDISLEHMDGDPGHGGDSLVRGEIG